MLKENLEKYWDDIRVYLTSSSSLGIVQLDDSFRIKDCNIGFIRQLGAHNKPVGLQLSDFIQFDCSNINYGEQMKLSSSQKSGMNSVIYCSFIKTENGALLLSEKVVLSESQALEKIGIMNDDLINLQRELVKKNRQLEKLKKDLDGRVAELEEAIERIKRLEGIVSICMYCKKIRNEDQSWEQLEQYITEHTDALFSHGICPVCFEKHYPDMAARKSET